MSTVRADIFVAEDEELTFRYNEETGYVKVLLGGDATLFAENLTAAYNLLSTLDFGLAGIEESALAENAEASAYAAKADGELVGKGA